MSAKLLVVTGATGNQGGSVINSILRDPELSQKYKIRAVTRNSSSSKAKELALKGVEVVEGDLDDNESINSALKGANVVFAVTLTNYDGDMSKEITQGKALADAAVYNGAEFIIFSTISSPSKISGGKYNKVAHFEAKYTVEKYIRSLPIRSAFYCPGSFYSNFTRVMRPIPTGDNEFAIRSVMAPDTVLPLVDIERDTGSFIGAILFDEDKYNGQTIMGCSQLLSCSDMAKTISEVTGKQVKYEQISEEDLVQNLPPLLADALREMFVFYREFGYAGPETIELSRQAQKLARGKLHSLVEYLADYPLDL
uniref:ARAD1D41052p n=1 Tax=Blastobotrys adeninivorans TaxID=409370 RepID=A0A060TD84_BLAAD